MSSDSSATLNQGFAQIMIFKKVTDQALSLVVHHFCTLPVKGSKKWSFSVILNIKIQLNAYIQDAIESPVL